MSFHTRMSVTCAESLASFLIVAAQRFEEDAKLCRAEGAKALAPPPADLAPGTVWCPPNPAAMESLARQFDKQARQARNLSEQFSDAYDAASPADFVSIVEGE